MAPKLVEVVLQGKRNRTDPNPIPPTTFNSSAFTTHRRRCIMEGCDRWIRQWSSKWRPLTVCAECAARQWRERSLG